MFIMRAEGSQSQSLSAIFPISSRTGKQYSSENSSIFYKSISLQMCSNHKNAVVCTWYLKLISKTSPSKPAESNSSNDQIWLETWIGSSIAMQANHAILSSNDWSNDFWLDACLFHHVFSFWNKKKTRTTMSFLSFGLNRAFCSRLAEWWLVDVGLSL